MGLREVPDGRDDIVPEEVGVPHDLAELKGYLPVNIRTFRERLEDGHQLGSALAHRVHIRNRIMEGHIDLDRPVRLLDTWDPHHQGIPEVHADNK